MAWYGWFALDGTEFINATRVEQYAKRERLSWVRDSYDVAQLPAALGDGPRYTSPLQDDAPWLDPDNPASWEFLGAYPVDVSGIEDSTRGSEVVEYTVDGGAPGRLRHATRAVVFNVLLVATSDRGAEYGMQWLKAALLGGPCAGTSPLTSPFGAELCYLSSEPYFVEDTFVRGAPSTPLFSPEDSVFLDGGDPFGEGDGLDGGTPDGPSGGESETTISLHPAQPYDYTGCLDPLRRTLRKFAVVGGPSVIQKYEPTDGALWQVQFTGVAGVPWEFGLPVDVISGFLTRTPVAEEGVTWDPDGFTFRDAKCEETLWGPLNDPLNPQFIAPPAPVSIPLAGAPLPTTWVRRQFTIPKDLVPAWTDVLPILSVRTGKKDLRAMRVRFYSDPFEEGDPNADKCSFCGDIFISYAPANSVLVFDTTSQSVYCDLPGGIRRRADALVFGADGQPFDWPVLSCGMQYIVTLDLPKNPSPVAAVDLTLIPRFR